MMYTQQLLLLLPDHVLIIHYTVTVDTKIETTSNPNDDANKNRYNNLPIRTHLLSVDFGA